MDETGEGRKPARQIPRVSRDFLRVSEGTRTPDRLDHNQELYQLSYAHRAGVNLPAPWAGLRGRVARRSPGGNSTGTGASWTTARGITVATMPMWRLTAGRSRPARGGPSLPTQARSKRGPFAPDAFSWAPILTTMGPSDSRCRPLDFTTGLYERSLLTRLGRRVSLVTRSDLARVQVPVPRRDPPHPIRNQDWRTWPSP